MMKKLNNLMVLLAILTGIAVMLYIVIQFIKLFFWL